MDRLGKILVMDDDDSLRELMQKMIEHLNYEAVICADGDEAIQLYRSALENNPFDMIIVDLTVPDGMGGIETIKSIEKFHPDVKAIVMSGGVDDLLSEENENKLFKAVIKKPFKMNELVICFEKVMNL